MVLTKGALGTEKGSVCVGIPTEPDCSPFYTPRLKGMENLGAGDSLRVFPCIMVKAEQVGQCLQG